MTLVTRAQWGARPSAQTGNSIATHPNGVLIHWEGPKVGSRDHSLCDDLVRSIQNFHMDVRGWVDIAYNFLVCEHGYIFEGRGVKRGSAANGTTEANFDYYAVCAMVGDTDAQPAALINGLREAVGYCQLAGAGTHVGGHRDVFPTDCPGDALYALVHDGNMTALDPTTDKPIGSQAASDVPPVAAPAPAPSVPPFPGTVRVGSTGSAVRAVQARLAARGWSITVDGIFGIKTEAVVKAFQAEKHLVVDGVAGPATWTALWTAPVTK